MALRNKQKLNHRAPCSNKGKEQPKTSRLEPTGNQALSPTLMEIMEIYGNLLISFWFSDPRVDL